MFRQCYHFCHGKTIISMVVPKCVVKRTNEHKRIVVSFAESVSFSILFFLQSISVGRLLSYSIRYRRKVPGLFL